MPLLDDTEGGRWSRPVISGTSLSVAEGEASAGVRPTHGPGRKAALTPSKPSSSSELALRAKPQALWPERVHQAPPSLMETACGSGSLTVQGTIIHLRPPKEPSSSSRGSQRQAYAMGEPALSRGWMGGNPEEQAVPGRGCSARCTGPRGGRLLLSGNPVPNRWGGEGRGGSAAASVPGWRAGGRAGGKLLH